jgi:hypothetical protein
MRRFYFILTWALMVAMAPLASAGSGKIIKVLPEYLDREGRNSISPSLFDRDAYQAMLRKEAAKRSGVAFFVQWKSHGVDMSHAKMKVEMRGVFGNSPSFKTVEMPVTHRWWLGHWTTLTLKGEDYKPFGDLVAWRVTFWEGDKQLSEQKSFLW